MRRIVAVLAGGPSCEREISLVSGKAVAEALESAGMEATLIDPRLDVGRVLAARGIHEAFLALHGTFGEDGTVQELLEAEGIRYTGSGPKASRLSFDKAETQSALTQRDIPVPDFVLLREASDERPLRYPCVVKPSKAGSSVGISLVQDASQFERARAEALKHSDTALAEDYVAGRELTVGILDGEPLPIVEIVPKGTFYDYKAKYQDAETRYLCPADLSSATAAVVRGTALAAYRALGCEVMGRVDIMLSKDGKPYVLEVNTIPGLTGRSLLPKAAKTAGIDFSALCVKILDLSMKRFERMASKRG